MDVPDDDKGPLASGPVDDGGQEDQNMSPDETEGANANGGVVPSSTSPPPPQAGTSSETFKMPAMDAMPVAKPKAAERVQGKPADPLPKDRSKVSPAEKMKLINIPLPYKEPEWGARCEQEYYFEVLKNGRIMDKVDLTSKSFYVFGRLPSCDVTMEHPSISRYHAIVQYCGVENDRREKGWYMYDLDSTHGTWVNKVKAHKSRMYQRLKVGHVVKFGGSTRLYILQGPPEDEETESALSITEMKEQREQQKKEAELLQLQAEEEREKEKAALEKKQEDQGCTWGIGDDAEAEDEDTENPFVMELQHEELYLDDPKKALKGYFEREGYDPPEYELTEVGWGKHQCKVEVPVDTATGEPLIAEATVSGKKKEAVVACALEACRMLDRLGELRKATHESRKRKKKNWEEDDFYDSDDDVYLDRTGDIERKRKQRMQKLGKGSEKAETYESLVEKLHKVDKEIEEIEEKLQKAKEDMTQVTSEEVDALDAYMKAIKSGAMDTKTKIRLKRELLVLKQDQQKLQRLVNIAQPAKLPALPKPGAAVRAKALPLFGKRKGPSSSVTNKPKLKAPSVTPVMHAADGDEEEEEDEEDDKDAVATLPDSAVQARLQPPEKETDQTRLQPPENNSNSRPDTEPGSIDQVESKAPKLNTETESAKNNDMSQSDSSVEAPNPKQICELKDKVKTNRTNMLNTLEGSPGQADSDGGTGDNTGFKGPSMPAPKVKRKSQPSEGEAAVMKAPVQKKLKEGRQMKKLMKEKSEGPKSKTYCEDDPDYAVWMPPSDQSGDGKTHLNEKFGY